MRLLIVGFAALAALTGVAEARDGCGPGWFFNGIRCVPARAAPPPPPVYVPPRPAPGPGPGFAGTDQWGKPMYFPGPGGRCPRNFTIQSGLCKPYRGF